MSLHDYTSVVNLHNSHSATVKACANLTNGQLKATMANRNAAAPDDPTLITAEL
jgi:hypothetical protein